jgi:hypothetical protein
MLKVVSPIERTNGRPYKHVVFMISQKKRISNETIGG